MPDVHMK